MSPHRTSTFVPTGACVADYTVLAVVGAPSQPNTQGAVGGTRQVVDSLTV